MTGLTRPRLPGQGDGSRDFGAPEFGRGPKFTRGRFPRGRRRLPGRGSGRRSAARVLRPEEYGQEHEVGPGGFPQRTPGRSFQDLPKRESRGRHSSAPAAVTARTTASARRRLRSRARTTASARRALPSAVGQDGAFGQEGGHGQDNGFGHARTAASATRTAAARTTASAAARRRPSVTRRLRAGQRLQPGELPRPRRRLPRVGREHRAGRHLGTRRRPGQDNDGGWGRPAGRSAAPWEERPQQDAGYPGPDGGQDFGQQDFGRQDYTRQAPRPSFSAQDYDGQDFGRPGRTRASTAAARDVTARMDPALQDFFAPQRGGAPGYPGQGPGRSGESRDSPVPSAHRRLGGPGPPARRHRAAPRVARTAPR